MCMSMCLVMISCIHQVGLCVMGLMCNIIIGVTSHDGLNRFDNDKITLIKVNTPLPPVCSSETFHNIVVCMWRAISNLWNNKPIRLYIQLGEGTWTLTPSYPQRSKFTHPTHLHPLQYLSSMADWLHHHSVVTHTIPISTFTGRDLHQCNRAMVGGPRVNGYVR